MQTIKLIPPFRTLLAALLLAVLLPACATPASTNPEPITLTVFAAASLTEPFEETGEAFESAHPGTQVVFNFAGSQQLAQQLVQGAPADVFASANQKQMETVASDGRVAAAAQQTFAKNRLVVIVPSDNPGGIHSLPDLAKSALRLVLAAREVPVGQYSLEFLEKAARDPAFGGQFKEGVLGNVVSYEDNVKAVLSKVALGEADAGIVYTSDISGENAKKVSQIEIPEALNVIATYPIALIEDSPHPDLARAFVAFVLSPEGQAALEKYGFIPVERE